MNSRITLQRIIQSKRDEVNTVKKEKSLRFLSDKIKSAPDIRDFKEAISGNYLSIIAEVKKRSPSMGEITGKDPIRIAKQYEKSKAAAISVLTDYRYFGGTVELMLRIKSITTKPILRKDFIIDEYQIWESRAYGADAILLIVSILNDWQLSEFINITKTLGMECLLECHSRNDIERVPETANIIGINNRDFDNGFTTSLNRTKTLINYVPNKKIIVSESGFENAESIYTLSNIDRRVNAILSGTAIVRSPNIFKTIDDFIVNYRRP